MPDITEGKIEVRDNKIEYNNIIFYIMDNNSNLKIEHLMGYDAVVVDAKDAEFARFIVKKIRAHYNPEFYLKPIFLINYKVSKDPILNYLHDGLVYSYDQIKEIAETAKHIFYKTTQLDYQLIPSFEAQAIKKVLNFMYTRDLRTLKPFVDLHSIIGYTYPEISVNFDNDEEAQVLDILEWAEREGLIWPDFHERVYLCNHCSSGFLSYREVCPHCNSSNSKSEDLIHHFPCAFIGPISDFKNPIDNTLTCPKCNKALRHIGVDYDKPSIIHHCNNCDNNFQDFFVKAKCISCEQDVDVQYLVPKSINIYKLTKKGRSAATNGFLSTGQEIEDIFGTINMPTLKVMLHYELERIKENQLQKTTLALVHLENIFELYNQIGKRAQKELLEDLVRVIRENIKPSDFIAFENSSTLYLCLINTDAMQAEQQMMHLSILIENLILNNFNAFKVTIIYKVKILNPHNKAESQLQELTKDLFA
ncbi:MAG: hypothetical protein K0Q95_857 [Bacteroidota bacterium]|jgi:hypothetical protein|nr:hypothetical protein [Bacteroidota bacterium]